MRRRTPRWPFGAGETLALLVCVTASLALLTVVVAIGARDLHLLRSDHTAEAVVLERASNGAVRVSFTTDDGRQVIGEPDVWTGTQVGDVITVRYHPDDPAFYVQDTRVHSWPFLLPAIALAGASWLAYLAVGIWRRGS